MFLNIDLDSKIPIYEQIENQIIIGISKEILEPGEILPSVRQLGIDLGVNFHTVNKAYKALESRGFLRMDRSSGTRVQEAIPKFREREETIALDSLRVIIAEYSSRGYSKKEITHKIQEIIEEVKSNE